MVKRRSTTTTFRVVIGTREILKRELHYLSEGHCPLKRGQCNILLDFYAPKIEDFVLSVSDVNFNLATNDEQ